MAAAPKENKKQTAALKAKNATEFRARWGCLHGNRIITFSLDPVAKALQRYCPLHRKPCPGTHVVVGQAFEPAFLPSLRGRLESPPHAMISFLEVSL
jgi:hypothetical protein